MSQIPSPAAVIDVLAEHLENLAIPYFIGGSLASSVHGEFRSTQDVDIVCDFGAQNVPAFIERLKPAFVIDEVATRKAVDENRTFNIFHDATLMKVDFFTKIGPFERMQINRAMSVKIPDATRSVRISSAEDTILAKLRWYRSGGEVSERQWRDIVGIFKVQGNRLDFQYLREWAQKLSVGDLLEKVKA